MFSGKDDLRGVASSRVRRPYKLFEALLDDALGDRVRADGACGVDLWCAIAGVTWQGPGGQEVRYSFRQAGDVVAWIREEADGFDWYCSGESGNVADWIARILRQSGWAPLPSPNVGLAQEGDAQQDRPI
ncbi:hypothetical protein [Sphingomonas sp. Leaf23]|uniref:hypothetical protein n=1 Tax=Sphingomonas sp. Leaf23 TaxID=1735689 RepID=UPI000A83F179|nr:hypothetical protein [Sphingomonas sp. Leaf23]